MKWFDKWFMNKVHWANNTPQEKEYDDGPNLIMSASKKAHRGLVTQSHHDTTELESRGVTFTLYTANGGHVVELRNYDEKTDRVKNSLHIVPHDKDLGEALNHIITYEALKR
jgi:hypothetical protein